MASAAEPTGISTERAISTPPGREKTLEQKDDRFRALYSSPPTFRRLAAADGEFAALLHDGELDFKDPSAVLQLSKTLLRHDFGLSLQLPPHRLCPPIPNRHNYILCLKDLLDSTSYDPPGGELVGVDIGTGASCIYPLLGVVQRPWSFIATDIDDESLFWARKNIDQNGLGHRIRLVRSTPDEPLIPPTATSPDAEDIAFVMTNPPFYRSAEEMASRAADKSLPPPTACTGAPVEMVTPGGEVNFVGRLLAQSLSPHLRARIRWYSATVGFLASVAALVGRLRDAGVRNYAVTELVQGRRTRRWVVAWSFRPMRPPLRLARGSAAAPLRPWLPAITEVCVVDLPAAHASMATTTTTAEPSLLSRFASEMHRALAALDGASWEWDGARLRGLLRTRYKVWTRAWRRRRKRRVVDGPAVDPAGDEMQTGATGDEGEDMGFRVWIQVNVAHIMVHCRWVEGFEESAFTSFTGFVKTTAEGIHTRLVKEMGGSSSPGGDDVDDAIADLA